MDCRIIQSVYTVLFSKEHTPETSPIIHHQRLSPIVQHIYTCTVFPGVIPRENQLLAYPTSLCGPTPMHATRVIYDAFRPSKNHPGQHNRVTFSSCDCPADVPCRKAENPWSP